MALRRIHSNAYRARSSHASRVTVVAAFAAFGVLLAGCGQVQPVNQVTAGVRSPATVMGGGLPPAGASISGNYLAGRFAHKIGDYGKAADFLSQALNIEPDNKDLLRRAYMVSIADGRMDDAVELAAALVKADPNAPLAGIALAIDEIRKGRYIEAERRLRGFRLRGFNRYIVPLMLGWTLAGQGKVDEALAAMRRLEEYPGLAMIRRLHAGLIHDFAGNRAAAATELESINKESKRLSLRAVQALGSIYERTGKAALGKALYEKYNQENPDSLVLASALDGIASGKPAAKLVSTAQQGVAEAFFNLAGSQAQENAAQLALIFGRIALALRPDFPIAQLLVGGILEALNRHKDAIAVYDAIPPSSPMNWTARLRRAASLGAMGREGDAIQQLQRMALEKTNRTDALIDLGDMLRASKRFSESVDAYDKAVARLGKMDKRHWPILYSRGIALERSKQWVRAEKDFVRALELSPEQPYVLNYLGYTWVDQGVNLERAKAMIERAVELRPNDGYIVDSLGWALYRMSDYGGAVKLLERAVELKSQDPTINDHLGDAYWQVGRRIEARFQWKRALSLEPEPEATASIEKKIVDGLADVGKAQGGI